MNAASSTLAANAAALPIQLAQGYGLLRDGRTTEAVAAARRMVQDWPDQTAVLGFAAEACNVQGAYEDALAFIDQAIAISDDPQLGVKKAWLLSRAHRRDEVIPLVDALAAAAGDNAVLLWQLGKLYYHHNRLEDAIKVYERSLARREAPNVRYDAALARFYSGDADGAERDLDSVLATRPAAGSIAYLRSTLRKQEPGRDHVAELQGWLAPGGLSATDEAGIQYALGKEWEDLGEHDRSFVAISAGARRKRESLDYDIGKVVAGLDEIISQASAEALAAAAPGHDEEGAIFILGMPRTGTTLTERILMQSGQLGNAGELIDFETLLGKAMAKVRAERPDASPTQAALAVDFAELGRLYMRDARPMAGGAQRFIDKMPANFMYCGMILKALPKARIIHLIRDPLDTCYAIYKTLFFRAYEFSYDQAELAAYYVAYRRLMQHWKAVMPGRILDLHYEDLVTDTETQARRLYDWCGLEWTPAALEVPGEKTVYATASAAQVRQPVHARSVGSAQRHREQLAPLADALAAAGLLATR